MMPNCQYIGCNEPAVFLGPNELPSACEEHLAKLEDRIARYRQHHPKGTDLLGLGHEDPHDPANATGEIMEDES